MNSQTPAPSVCHCSYHIQRTCYLHFLGIRMHGIIAQMTIILIFTNVRNKNIFTTNPCLRTGFCIRFLLELSDFNWRRRFLLGTGKEDYNNECISLQERCSGLWCVVLKFVNTKLHPMPCLHCRCISYLVPVQKYLIGTLLR